MLIHIHYATRQGKKQVLSIIHAVRNWIYEGIFYLFLREGDKRFSYRLLFCAYKTGRRHRNCVFPAGE